MDDVYEKHGVGVVSDLPNFRFFFWDIRPVVPCLEFLDNFYFAFGGDVTILEAIFRLKRPGVRVDVVEVREKVICGRLIPC